ncbi:FHA domain-containing protein [Candidatus Marithrix sp. Canyon 246]|uniref:FHA domain-containing protein n=1 Tax=Candidatus Marithrix sp. Canyon 246 TaxID=1827136 RepID=UPI00084A27A9|nr:FHA domain-containing protein [Candidatus Marithrix sp. Canyon 246]
MFILSNYYIEIGILLLILTITIVYITKYFESGKFVRKAAKNSITKDGWLISGADIKLTISDVQLNAARLGITIGSSAKLSELLVHDNSVSHRHARISYIKNDLYIEDLNSFNGLWRNNQALKPFEKLQVQSGETLVLGEIPMSFKRL